MTSGEASDARSGPAAAEAFQALADEHLDAAYRLARIILRDQAEAQDATHDAFVQAWRKWSTLRDPDRFEAWFDRILVNACRDRLRDHPGGPPRHLGRAGARHCGPVRRDPRTRRDRTCPRDAVAGSPGRSPCATTGISRPTRSPGVSTSRSGPSTRDSTTPCEDARGHGRPRARGPHAMNDTDVELERRLRVHFRDSRDADGASLALRADVLAIPHVRRRATGPGAPAPRADAPRRDGRPRDRCRGLGPARRRPADGAPASVAQGRRGRPVAVRGSGGDRPPRARRHRSSRRDGRPASPTATDGRRDWPAAGRSDPRILPTATLLQDGRVLVRWRGTQTARQSHRPSSGIPIRDVFTGGHAGPAPIGHAAALLQDGRVLIVGGEDGRESVPAAADHEVWDPATGGSRGRRDARPAVRPDGHDAHRWPRPHRRSDFCLVRRSATLSGRRRCPVTDRFVIALEPRRHSRRRPRGAEEREWHTATLLPDGRVLLVGNTSWSMDDPESPRSTTRPPTRLCVDDEPRDLSRVPSRRPCCVTDACS